MAVRFDDPTFRVVDTHNQWWDNALYYHTQYGSAMIKTPMGASLIAFLKELRPSHGTLVEPAPRSDDASYKKYYKNADKIRSILHRILYNDSLMLFSAKSLVDSLLQMTELIRLVSGFKITMVDTDWDYTNSIGYRPSLCPFSGREPNRMNVCKGSSELFIPIIDTFFYFFIYYLKQMPPDELIQLQKKEFSYAPMLDFFKYFFYFISTQVLDVPIELYRTKFAEINELVKREWFILDCTEESKEEHVCGRAYGQIECDATEYYKIILFNNVPKTEMLDQRKFSDDIIKYEKNIQCGGRRRTRKQMRRKGKKRYT